MKAPQDSPSKMSPPAMPPRPTRVPFFRVELHQAEIDEVVGALRSGWLTTGPRAKLFEERFAASVGARHAIALNSCTAALHLGVEAMGLKPGQAVLVPTMTFAATAEVVRYLGGVPILVDCDPLTLNVDLDDAERKLADLRAGRLPQTIDKDSEVVGMIPVHVGGQMMDVDAIHAFARRHGLWIVEDAAHAFPAAWRETVQEPWRQCGQDTAAVTCFSFYANKTITTGEGGMAVTDDDAIAERIRVMSLHGLSRDAWQRYNGNGSWDYQIIAPGYKYNITDIAAAIGIHQLAAAEDMRLRREEIAELYLAALADTPEIELPAVLANRIHAWHLFPIRLNLHRLSADRDSFLEVLRVRGVGCSVHWRPLHLHGYYRENYRWKADAFPTATAEWERLISLPLFPGMREEEVGFIVQTVRGLCQQYRLSRPGVPKRPR